MDLIQPFIGSLDAVLAEMMKTAPRIVDLSMEEEGYRRKGLAASVSFKGEIQGRVILDMDPQAAAQVASHLAGDEVDSSQPIVREAVCELANMVIGNSVTLLNDQGFRFKVFPPEIHVNEQGLSGGADTEAMVICIETLCGEVYLNIAMHYLHRRRRERDAAAVLD
jgi:CheY-specific phosphatase CheX